MSVFEFVLAALAVWRVTHLFAAEDGPLNSIAWLRKTAGAGFWGQLLDCFYCLSLWIAIPFALWLSSSWRQRVLFWLALSATAILINRVVDRIAPETPIYFEEPEKNPKERV
jgi:uncharacterized protein DUF1360